MSLASGPVGRLAAALRAASWFKACEAQSHNAQASEWLLSSRYFSSKGASSALSVGSGAEDPDLDRERPEGITRIYRIPQADTGLEEDGMEDWGDLSLNGEPVDLKSTILADAIKERIFQRHKESPSEWTVPRLASEYKISQERVHAIIWLKDMEKEQIARGEPVYDDICEEVEDARGAEMIGGGERWKKPLTKGTLPRFEQAPEEFASEHVVVSVGKSYEEASLKYEAASLQEFIDRMEFNKRIMAGDPGIIMDKRKRQRPKEGWSYVITELGSSGKRGKKGGKRFVAEANGTHRPLNDIEKLFLKRETVRPRRRDFQ